MREGEAIHVFIEVKESNTASALSSKIHEQLKRIKMFLKK